MTPRRRRALVIEDDEAVGHFLAEVVTTRGYVTTLCAGGRSGLAAWRRGAPDLVILDLVLPDADGLDICREMRADPSGRDSLILVCTRRRRPEDVEAILAAGADDYLPKPIDTGYLLARLAFLERGPRAQAGSGASAEESPTLTAEDEGLEEHRSTAGMAAPTSEGVAGHPRYQIISNIGSGASSEVFAARDSEIGEVVALKVLRPEVAPSEEWQRRIRLEIKLGRTVKHPNICMIYDVGHLGDRLFLAMELVPGRPLSDVVKERGALPEQEVLDLLLPAIDGIAEAHRLGIVHRDLKPSNIILTPEGRTVVLDFGLARRAIDERHTVRGQITGTPAYMAPEQIRDGPLSPATDVYGLGCVLFQLLTGRVPFVDTTVIGVISRQLGQEAPPLRSLAPSVREEIEAVVAKCLRKDPLERFPDARSLAGALRQAEGSRPSTIVHGAILLGEADVQVVEEIAAAAREQGMMVKAIDDGHKLVETALASRPQAVIVDESLPFIGGLEAMRILRSFPQTASTPMALLSEKDDLRAFVESVAPGALFLRKPIQWSVVVALLRDLVASAARQPELDARGAK